MEPLLTIAIPTYNNYQQLYWCLCSLTLHTDYPYKIIVINNCLENASRLETAVENCNFDKIEVVHAKKNEGWIGGINLALSMTDTKYFCMMNDDVLFLPHSNAFWRVLTEHFNDPEVAAVGPCSNYVAGVQNLYDIGTTPLITETSLLIGFCMLVRTQLMKDIGGLDDQLCAGDDLDLSIRFLKMGKKLICNKSVYLHHIGQQTGRKVHPETWDSAEMQETSYNQLIRKHGVKAWYQTYCGGWNLVKSTVKSLEGMSEDDWLEERIKPYKGNGAVGMNVGCGSRDVDLGELRLIDLDIAKTGESGVGGRKFSGAEPEIVSDALSLPIQNNGLDFIIALHLFEHLVDPLEALQEWKRALREDGHLFLSIPDHNRTPTTMLDCSHVHAYTPLSVSRLLESDGWEVHNCDSLSWGVIVCDASPGKEAE